MVKGWERWTRMRAGPTASFSSLTKWTGKPGLFAICACWVCFVASTLLGGSCAWILRGG